MEQERTCVITRETLEVQKLVRFVASPDGVLVPDVWRKLPGRGIWVKASRELFEDPKTAPMLKSRASSQLKQKLDLLVEGEELAGLIEGQMKQQTLNRMGLMRAAGQVVTGFEKVASTIRGGKIITWVEASDGQNDGTSKLEGLTRGLTKEIPVVDMFSRDELSKALGGGNVVHAALMDKRQASRFMIDVLRLSQFQGKAIPYVGGVG